MLIFGVGNHELDFIGCLTYCLIQLNSDMKIVLDGNMKTMWHVNPANPEDNLTAQQAQNLMSIAASRVWEELYICKKPAIEEVCSGKWLFLNLLKCIILFCFPWLPFCINRL